MENTKGLPFIYHVGSDIETSTFFAEFESEDKAIAFAKRNMDKLPFVQKVILEYDENGIETAVDYIDIWDHTMEDTTDTNIEDDFFAFKDEVPAIESLVETMEENEEMVECKECFELFPKANCTKLEVGYICPICSDHCCDDTHDDSDVDIILVADEDTFKVDFPEYEKFRDTEDEFDDSKLAMSDEDVARVNEPFESDDEPELTPEEAVPFLVKDEEEAIAGYEKAAEVIEASDVENKEEILDTLEHIKEEEEEHIEELTDLVDDEIIEVENDSISDEEEIETIEDPESAVLNEDTELKTWICWYEGNDIGTVEAATEEEATELMMTTYPEYQYNNTDWSVELADEEYLTEHVNEEHPAIESDQELKGTDNAVVDCKVAKVIAHSEDEKPVDCEGKKKPLEKPLTEAIIGKLNSEADEIDLIEFTELCKEIGIETVSDLERFAKDEANREGSLLDKLKSYRAELGADFKVTEEVFDTEKKLITETFTKEEQKEYNMDEYGVSLDGYDEYVRCTWCGEIFTKDSCVFEANLGWLCDRCYQAILSRGEKLTIIKNPTEEDIARTLTEEVKMTAKELKDKFGTDDVDLINAGREPEERVELTEDADEIELTSDPAEKNPGENVKMANTSSTSGMDFETACQTFGVELQEAVGEEIKMPFSDLPEEEQEYIKDFTKFINDAIANKTELTADDILKFKDTYNKTIVNNK